MPVSRDLKRRILQNPFSWQLRMHLEVDREAYAHLLADIRLLVVQTADDREMDKEVLQAIWNDIRVAEGVAARFTKWGRDAAVIFEIENMAIELDGGAHRVPGRQHVI